MYEPYSTRDEPPVQCFYMLCLTVLSSSECSITLSYELDIVCRAYCGYSCSVVEVIHNHHDTVANHESRCRGHKSTALSFMRTPMSPSKGGICNVALAAEIHANGVTKTALTAGQYNDFLHDFHGCGFI